MESSLEFSRWKEKPNGVNYRRWVIVSTGLKQVLQIGFFRVLLVVAWISSFLLAGTIFVFSQSVASGGWLEALAAGLGPRPEAIAKALGAMVLMYPDLCIHTLYTFVFWLQSFAGLWLSLLALTSMVPQLITRDRAGSAMTIYLSRPLTSADYLLGKLGVIVGLLALCWTGPLLFGWLLSALLAPNRDFLLYSFSPLGHALLFNLIGLVVLSSIALGVSALNKNSRNTILWWIGVWILAGMVADVPHTPNWIRRASFSYGLMELRQEVFRLDAALLESVQTLPLIDRNLTRSLTRLGTKAAPTDTKGAAAGLAILALLSSAVFLKKLRPE